MAQSASVEASEAVASLYTQRLSDYLSGKRIIQNGTPIPSIEWRSLARRFPLYEDTINALGSAINEAELMRDHTPLPETETYRQLFFSGQISLQEPHGAYFLADILHHRVNRAVSNFQSISIPQEAHAILAEYGNPDGLLTARNGQAGTPLYLLRAVAQVLAGEIKLTPQRIRS